MLTSLDSRLAPPGAIAATYGALQNRQQATNCRNGQATEGLGAWSGPSAEGSMKRPA